MSYTNAELLTMDPLDIFVWWVKERHMIWRKRQRGEPKPWTVNEILQTEYINNPFRENDKTTVWFRENVRDKLRDRPEVFFATVLFRWFNLIETGRILLENDLFEKWDPELALRTLCPLRDAGQTIFTGAYVIACPPNAAKKVEGVVGALDQVWKVRHKFTEKPWPTLQRMHISIAKLYGLGDFMAYEIVTDLRYTYLLEKASDILTWCNPGPGAIRGLMRVVGRPFPKGDNSKKLPVPSDWAQQTQMLLRLLQKRLPAFGPWEMHQVEMSLCEVDKLLRVLYGDGKSKRRYAGT